MSNGWRLVGCLSLLSVVSFVRPAAANSFVYDGHGYLVVEQNRTWLNAALDAATRQLAGASGYLAIIDSEAESDAVFAQLLAAIPPAEFNETRAPDGGNGVYVWIAATDRITEGQWIWDGVGAGAGTQFWQGTGNGVGNIVGGLYNNWGHDPRNPQEQWEPDNGAGGLQDAGGIGLADWPRGFAGEWNDVRADNSLYYLVEFNAVPEPPTFALLALAAVGLAVARPVGPAVRTISHAKPSLLGLIVSVCLLLLAGPAAAADDPQGFHTLQIGDQAPDFELPGVDGKQHALKDFADAKLLLVVFTCNHCPTAQAYEDRLEQLHADFKDRGVALVAISPNDDQAVRLDELGYTDLGDSLEDMKLRAKERGFEFPYLYDGETQKTSLAYGVVATPQVFLFDEQRALRYVGRIDDAEVREITSHDARNALEALLAGKSVPVERTRTFGCSTKWAAKRADAQKSLEKWDQEPVSLEPLDEEGLAKLAANDTDKLLLVNLWATWCGPCLTELPELVTMNRMYRGRKFQLVTISLDEPEQKADALEALEKRKVSATNYLSVVANRDRLADLIDKDWAGPLPHTVLIAPGGKVLYRKNGPIDPLELRRAIVDVLGRTYASREKE